MNTPISDFVNEYNKKNPIRLHMPGHKGNGTLDIEGRDITEIDGADSLFDAAGIIKESEANASSIFSAHTFYSCEGSSLSIRAMLYLALLYGKSIGRKPLILAGRNAHKTFITAAALLDLDVLWLYGQDNASYLSASISASSVEAALKAAYTLPIAVYITSPDYIGTVTDICSIAQVCKKYNVLLLVDNAHGAYLKFTGGHPMDIGADMCADSAHKTLPALTGGAYLHVSRNAPAYLYENAKKALAVFASTSPSYLILQSLDKLNPLLKAFEAQLKSFIPKVEALKAQLIGSGFTLYGNEPLKLTVMPKSYGYTGTELSNILFRKNVVCEFADKDFIVFMLSPQNGDEALSTLKDILTALPRRSAIDLFPPAQPKAERVLSLNKAMLSPCETVPAKACIGRICAIPSVSCPPAVPIVTCGEKITKAHIECFNYYGINEICVIK